MKSTGLVVCVLAAGLTLATGCSDRSEPVTNVNTQARVPLSTGKPDPNDLSALISHGNQCMDNGQYAEAIDSYQKALALTPDNVNVRVDMGTCYRRTGRSSRALEEYRKGLEYQPDHHNALVNMGIVLAYDMRDTEGALQAWQKFLDLAPDGPVADKIRQEMAKISTREQ